MQEERTRRIKNINKVKRGKLKIKLLGGIVCSLLIVLTLCPWVVFYGIIYDHVDYQGEISSKYPMQGIYRPEEFGLEAKELELVTEDGLKLWAAEVSVQEPKAVIIYLSGIMQPSVTYFYGHSKWMKEKGYATLLLEVRSHGKSEGKRIGLGYEEVEDVRAAVNYLKQQPCYKDVPIVIHGVSMGGAIAINAFGEIEEMDGLIAMSAYSGFEEVVEDLLCRFHVPQFICTFERKIIGKCIEVTYGKDKLSRTPREAIQKHNGRPILLIACSGDQDVPPSNMERLKEVAPPHCETWLRDSWEHFIVKNCDFKNMEQDTAYCERILEFLENKVVYKEVK